MPEFSNIPATAQEFVDLRVAAGMRGRSLAAAERGLAHGLYGVWLRDGTRLVGMGRIIGDGGCHAFVTDIVVHPDVQGRGHGRAIMDALNVWCDANLTSGCFLGLIADPGAERLYEATGFGPCTGMSRVIP